MTPCLPIALPRDTNDGSWIYLFQNKCRWRLVYDQMLESAKRRKGFGIQALEDAVCLDFRPDLWGDLDSQAVK